MEVHNDATLPVELKYCERCGGLWVRSYHVSTFEDTVIFGMTWNEPSGGWTRSRKN